MLMKALAMVMLHDRPESKQMCESLWNIQHPSHEKAYWASQASTLTCPSCCSKLLSQSYNMHCT